MKRYCFRSTAETRKRPQTYTAYQTLILHPFQLEMILVGTTYVSVRMRLYDVEPTYRCILAVDV